MALRAVRPVRARAAASTWGQGVGLLGNDGGLDGDLLSVSSLLPRFAYAKHSISHLEIRHAFADGADQAGKIATQGEWKLRLLVLADAHLPVGTVDAGGDHVDDHLAWCGDRIRQVAVLQDLGPAKLLDENCLHRV
jgi:hypothetical protein